ncbi:MAG: hypothetical protein IPK15_00605 [Verrucomicrobia bacterium]|nr:hypothetical protein [Verrucomicrobiota bacterium]
MAINPPASSSVEQHAADKTEQQSEADLRHHHAQQSPQIHRQRFTQRNDRRDKEREQCAQRHANLHGKIGRGKDGENGHQCARTQEDQQPVEDVGHVTLHA